jgi:hypothetical protein
MLRLRKPADGDAAQAETTGAASQNEMEDLLRGPDLRPGGKSVKFGTSKPGVTLKLETTADITIKKD